MSTSVLEQRRTWWDVVVGLVLVVAGVLVLGNVVLATALSVLFLGWTVLLAGLTMLIGSLFRIGEAGFWSTALGGGLLLVLGLVMIRNPGATALTITLVVGAMFFATGLTRVVLAFHESQYRWVLVLSGLISMVLGGLVLFNLVGATFTLLGVLLGAQAVLEGLTTIALGRLRPAREVERT